MNEDQLKLFIQQAFANEQFAATALENADPVLTQALKNVRQMVESLPEGQVMRQIMWREMLPAIANELAPYNEALADSVVRELLDGHSVVEEDLEIPAVDCRLPRNGRT